MTKILLKHQIVLVMISSYDRFPIDRLLSRHVVGHFISLDPTDSWRVGQKLEYMIVAIILW